jgi:hypothetical protein
VGAATHRDYILGGVLGHQVLISEVKTLGLTFNGYIWQSRIYIGLLVEGIV